MANSYRIASKVVCVQCLAPLVRALSKSVRRSFDRTQDVRLCPFSFVVSLSNHRFRCHLNDSAEALAAGARCRDRLTAPGDPIRIVAPPLVFLPATLRARSDVERGCPTGYNKPQRTKLGRKRLMRMPSRSLSRPSSHGLPGPVESGEDIPRLWSDRRSADEDSRGRTHDGPIKPDGQRSLDERRLRQ